MTFRFGENTTISRLRVPYSGDALAARLHYSGLIGSMSLHPALLAPSAIVFIKRLQTQCPQHSFSAEWRYQIISDLSSLIGRAARPARETVSSEVECLFFADEAELLACLTSDWLRGNATQKWWWKSLLKNSDIFSEVMALWRKHTESVPAALHLLSKRGEVVRFVEALTENEVYEIWQNVALRFALPRLSLLSLTESKERETEQTVFNEEKKHRAIQHRANKIIVAPWQDVSQEIPTHKLSPEEECFLGIALTLFRSPSIARSRGFAAQTVRWFKQVKMLEKKSEERITEIVSIKTERAINKTVEVFQPSKAETQDSIETNFKHEKISSEKETQISKPKFEFVSLSKEEKIESHCGGERKQPTLKPQVWFDESTRLTKEVKTDKRKTSPDSLPQNKKKELRKKYEEWKTQTLQQEIAVPSKETEQSEIESQIITRFGGVFYLVNLALYLNLYNDFTSPKESGLDLNIWDFVFLLGQRLTGDSQDDVWSLLANLAGRKEEEPPAQNFIPPNEWGVPTEWLEPFHSNEFWFWSDEENRLRVWHPSGFVVLDLPLEKNVRAQLRKETKHFSMSRLKYVSQKFSRMDFDDGCSTEISRWLDWISSYVRARLLIALGQTNEEETTRLLCEQRAKVFVTPTHLDVVFSLQDLPIEIRLSGLDRNPGWIPFAGKFVAFHYE
jgi:hypothetical protein